MSGGRAFGSSDQFHALLDPLADKLGAAVGASRACGRRGLCAERLSGRPDRQDRRAPGLYRDRHLRSDPAPRGHEGSKTIVAINKDQEAPIFQVADIGLVGDLFKIVPELTEKI